MRGALLTLVSAVGLGAGVGAAQAGPVAAMPTPKFEVIYPRSVTAIPALRSYLGRREDRLHDDLIADAKRSAIEARRSGFKPQPYESKHEWSVVTQTPRFLSLLVDRYDYTGGAHGMDRFDTLLWDKPASAPRSPLSLFADPARLSATIRPAYCRALDAERSRKRGGDFNPADKEFNACIDPVKQTVLLGSSTGRRFDRIGIVAAPYEAGPYAEGSYEVTLPVTPAIVAQVRPEWRTYFAVRGTP